MKKCSNGLLFYLLTVVSSVNSLELPVDVKIHYEKSPGLCGVVYDSVVEKIKANYMEEKLSVNNERYIRLSWLTLGTEKTDMSISNWNQHKLILIKPEIEIVRKEVDYFIGDINNDKIREYVESHVTSNNISEGRSWNVYENYIPGKYLKIEMEKARGVISFDFSNNNINLSPGYGYLPSGSNFLYDFFKYEEHVYVLIKLSSGYSPNSIALYSADGNGIFKESYVIADLNKEFHIDKQYCYFDVSIEDVSGKLN